MIRKLPPASAEKILAKINRAGDFLTKRIVLLPTELQKGTKSKQEVDEILCEASREWAWDLFIAILQEWAEIGIPLDEFDAIASEQIESLSTHAEERVAGFVSGFDLSSGAVHQCVREFLPGLIAPYREENRFRFHAVTARGEAPAPAKLEKPRAAEPTAESTFHVRASWLKARLLERGWSNSDPAGFDGPDRKTIQKILRGESVRNDVLQKLADALSKRHGKVNVLEIPQD
jgi:hypothetical protein